MNLTRVIFLSDNVRMGMDLSFASNQLRVVAISARWLEAGQVALKHRGSSPAAWIGL